MALIQLFSNGIAIDFVKETLTIKKENNALITDFKVSHSSVPFLIIENATTVQALGSRDLTSISKKRIVPVDVIELGEKYYGELQILSYVNGYRKCNLKYATEVLTIMNKKIASFMPVVSVIPGETNPIAYTTETDTNVIGEINWASYPILFLAQNFPAVKWQFPTMDWSDKFGGTTETTDDWAFYQGKINKYIGVELLLNKGVYENNNYIIENKNVVSPQVFLLSPLFYALQQIGFTYIGEFTAHELINKLLFLSTKDNMTKSIVYKTIGDVILSYNESQGSYVFLSSTLLPGTYFFYYSIPIQDTGTFYYVFNGSSLTETIISNNAQGFRTGFVKFTVTTSEVDLPIAISYSGGEPVSGYSIVWKIGFYKPFYQMHTTIETGRFVPEWTFGEYLNQLKNTFNLDISINDFKKEIRLDFVDDFILSEEKVILNKSLEILSYEQVPYEAFILEYANDEDNSLYITSEGAIVKTTQSSPNDVLIKNKFKFIPMNSLTANLSQELNDKEGTGLMIYNPANKPFISESLNGKNLKIDGAGGIYETFWLKTVKFRLNASVLELSGPFSEIELKKIANIKKIYIDNQAYIVASLKYSETDQENFMLNLNLESINY